MLADSPTDPLGDAGKPPGGRASRSNPVVGRKIQVRMLRRAPGDAATGGANTPVLSLVYSSPITLTLASMSWEERRWDEPEQGVHSLDAPRSWRGVAVFVADLRVQDPDPSAAVFEVSNPMSPS